jgi:hypothetical protein
VVHELGRRSAVKREAIYALLQPDELPDVNGSEQAKQTIRAAVDLHLVEEEGQALRPSERVRSRAGRPARTLVLQAIDEFVLGRAEVEPYFAPFYAYLLGLNADGAVVRDGQDWANDFNRVVYGGALTTNPFNKDKHRGLARWLPYAGLGWTDPGRAFHCNPYHRLERALPTIFGTELRLDVDAFMTRLAGSCPELDGGGLFRTSNSSWNAALRECTLGLSHALLELHHDGRLVLHCPLDSHGWSLALADPPRDDRHLRSPRVDAVEYRPAADNTE